MGTGRPKWKGVCLTRLLRVAHEAAEVLSEEQGPGGHWGNMLPISLERELSRLRAKNDGY